MSTPRANWRSDRPRTESALVNMKGAPELRALIAPRYSFTTWCSIVRFNAPSALLTLIRVKALAFLLQRVLEEALDVRIVVDDEDAPALRRYPTKGADDLSALEGFQQHVRRA